jgi:hypothetical protein
MVMGKGGDIRPRRDAHSSGFSHPSPSLPLALFMNDPEGGFSEVRIAPVLLVLLYVEILISPTGFRHTPPLS